LYPFAATYYVDNVTIQQQNQFVNIIPDAALFDSVIEGILGIIAQVLKPGSAIRQMDVADADAKAIIPVIRRNVNLKLVIFCFADAHRLRYFL